jgi:hypothetical protein
MVMFHHEISYRAALQRGLIQARLLAELTAGAATLADIDFHYAAREIELKLAPVSPDASAVQSLSNVTKL